MKLLKNLGYCALVGLLCMYSCGDPECNDTEYILNARMLQQSQQFLIQNEALDVETVDVIFMQDTAQVRSQAMMEPSLGGFVVTTPENIQGDAQIFVDDPDCGLLLISDGVSVQDPSFFINNPNFIAPAPLNLVIPTVSFSPPPLVSNGWLSLNDHDYCIWFGFLDRNGYHIEFLNPEKREESIYLNPVEYFDNGVGSLENCDKPRFGVAVEFKTSLALKILGALTNDGNCGGGPTDYGHLNPVSGIVDKENNYISIEIDRRNKNLGTEKFTGVFIDKNDPSFNSYLSDSDGNIDTSIVPEGGFNHIMVLTSEKTGNQLLLGQVPG